MKNTVKKIKIINKKKEVMKILKFHEILDYETVLIDNHLVRLIIELSEIEDKMEKENTNKTFMMIQSQLTNMQTEMKQQFGEIRIEMDSRFDKISTDFNLRFDKVDSRLDKVDSRLDKVDSRLDKVDSRLENIEKDVSLIKSLPTIQKELNEIPK